MQGSTYQVEAEHPPNLRSSKPLTRSHEALASAFRQMIWCHLEVKRAVIGVVFCWWSTEASCFGPKASVPDFVYTFPRRLTADSKDVNWWGWSANPQQHPLLVQHQNDRVLTGLAYFRNEGWILGGLHQSASFACKACTCQGKNSLLSRETETAKAGSMVQDWPHRFLPSKQVSLAK